MNIKTSFLAFLAWTSVAIAQPHQETNISKWQFSRTGAEWQQVNVPHDWAISGPFDKKWDLQVVAIKENGEDKPTEHSGRSGSLPWIGKGYYKTTFSVAEGTKHVELVFDGAMANPVVKINGKVAGGWAYGYNAFRVDASPYVHAGENSLEVALENYEESNRWYPGAGIYRPVTLVTTKSESHLDLWGLQMQTLSIEGGKALIDIRHRGKALPNGAALKVTIADKAGRVVASGVTPADGMGDFHTQFTVNDPQLWSPETPYLYDVALSLEADGQVLDEQHKRLGIRTVRFSAEGGFQLNGVSRKIKGVCLHHDLGPLGAAVNKAAIIRQIRIMKDMGADAIRTSHNMPSTMQMEVCDSMGMMVMAESFDGWKEPKVKNGYGRFWDEWWQKDITNLILNHRNHPSIVMWSVGNEIPEQWKPEGAERYKQLIALCHQLDPSRQVTCGMDQPDGTIWGGFAQVADVPGYNYRVHKYEEMIKRLPQGYLLGSETASTVSSRGEYFFPDTVATGKMHPNGQCSSYDTEYCWWSNLPDDDWRMQDDFSWVTGEFVWTGFDYLGEPTPYDSYWPSRSSYFGIVDLAGLPKDRFYLYRSHWNKNEHTIHLLPHWTWPSREGEVTPVYCYTDYPSAELFVNGKSQGRITKNKDSRLDRYRLRWQNVKYEKGEIKVVVYDEQGRVAGEKTVKTAGKPAKLHLCADRATIAADGVDLAFVTVSLTDKHGNLCPDADNQLEFKVSGAARFNSACNGDATSLEVFTEPTMRLFHGQLVVVVQAADKAGTATLTVRDKTTGIKATLPIVVK
ncbi:MAG: glycoside hydrolase family 2 TIM barrel-domain containing protein [Bacteroidales bacterium]|nr:glycoside hydrolase family 2 TIM barrel-domain containing protein [Bacteroidales bacterium]